MEVVADLHLRPYYGEEYPAFWDEEAETFTGSLSTNAIEGGNWRLNYGLRTSYARVPRGTARTALLALDDSMYVFRNGRPEVSFAHRVGEFSYEDVMGQSVRPIGPALTNRHVKAAAQPLEAAGHEEAVSFTNRSCTALLFNREAQGGTR